MEYRTPKLIVCSIAVILLIEFIVTKFSDDFIIFLRGNMETETGFEPVMNAILIACTLGLVIGLIVSGIMILYDRAQWKKMVR